MSAVLGMRARNFRPRRGRSAGAGGTAAGSCALVLESDARDRTGLEGSVRGCGCGIGVARAPAAVVVAVDGDRMLGRGREGDQAAELGGVELAQPAEALGAP